MTVYIVAHVNVTDPQRYPDYASHTEASAKPFGGTFLVKGGAQEVLEGDMKGRTAIVSFPDAEAARAWYHSETYTALREIALQASDRDLILVEGI